MKQVIQSDNNKKNDYKKILFLRPGKLGDMIVATPIFRAVKQLFPDMSITTVASPYNEIIIRHNEFIDNIRIVNYHSFIAVIKMILWIRHQQFCWVIDLTPGVSKTSSMISRFVRSPSLHTAGMHKGDHCRYFDRVTDFQGIHVIDRNRLLVEHVLDCNFGSEFKIDIPLLDIHRCKAMEILKPAGDNPFLIGINCSAGKKCRQWSEDKHLSIVKQINAAYPQAFIVLFSVGIQNEWVKRIKEQAKNVIPLFGVDILFVSAVIKRMSFFLTPDTSLLHIASGFQIPTVGLYCISGENYTRWHSYNTLSRDLIAQSTGDVNEISPEIAFKALQELIEIKSVN